VPPLLCVRDDRISEISHSIKKPGQDVVIHIRGLMRPFIKLSQLSFDLEPEPFIESKPTGVVRLDGQFDPLGPGDAKRLDSLRDHGASHAVPLKFWGDRQ
jgi:hypothetical protein